tara:strand:+ start:165 stop:329 length:165 start_codon:yes stop_codon:yes gene_type:complete
MISYPDKPWNDGQTFSVTQKDGTYVVGTYNESKNAWSFTRVTQPPVEVPPDPNS